LSDASHPAELGYHPGHGWAGVEGETAVLGITAYAQDQLGEIVFFHPPEVGAELRRGSAYGEIESIKAASDVVAPLSGEVLEVNETVSAAPDTVNRDPYGAGWLIRMRISEAGEVDSLLDAAGYEALIASG
jgi:glycine cleavage system H protein